MNKIDEFYDELDRQEQEYENQEYWEQQKNKEIERLQQRIDKAIEYIEEHKRNVYDTFGEGIVFGEMGGIKELLNILRGEE